MTAETYICRIKNQNKRAYAAAYWLFLTKGITKPGDTDYGASPMACQSVRLRLNDFFNGN